MKHINVIHKKINILFYYIGVFFITRYLKYYNTNKGNHCYTNERSIEYSFALNSMSKTRIFKVLDVGSGTNSFPSLLNHCGYDVVASDLMGSYWKRFHNRHIYVCKDDITDTHFSPSSFDAVTCISVLEHIVDYGSAISNMAKVLKQGGIIILSFPYSNDKFVENVYKLDDADEMARNFKYIARSFSNYEIERWSQEYGLTIVDKKFIKGWEGRFWRTGERIRFPIEVDEEEEANCICLTLKKL